MNTLRLESVFVDDAWILSETEFLSRIMPVTASTAASPKKNRLIFCCASVTFVTARRVSLSICSMALIFESEHSWSYSSWRCNCNLDQLVSELSPYMLIELFSDEILVPEEGTRNKHDATCNYDGLSLENVSSCPCAGSFLAGNTSNAGDGCPFEDCHDASSSTVLLSCIC